VSGARGDAAVRSVAASTAEHDARSRERAERSSARRVRSALAWTLLAFAALSWFAALRPQGMGGPAAYVMVQGISMEPTLHTGDVVVVHRASSYLPGDLVAYRVPAGDVGAGNVVIHRIVGGSAEAGFVTQGDNNPTTDDWHPKASDIVGKKWVVLPKLGRALVLLQSPLILASLAMGVTVALLVGAPPKRKETASADPGADEDPGEAPSATP
jgi:signal peptidase I